MTNNESIIYSKYEKQDVATSKIMHKMQMQHATNIDAVKRKHHWFKTLTIVQVWIDEMPTNWRKKNYITNMPAQETVPIFCIY